MNDRALKFLLAGILFCLLVIAFKPVGNNTFTTPAPNVNVSNMQQFVQLAPNRIGIIDTGSRTGNKGQLIIFDYDQDTKTFKYAQTLNASYILDHPQEFGIPTRN